MSEIVVSYLINPKTFGVLNESPESECSPGRTDQLQDGVCSIEQRRHDRHREQKKSRSLGREVLMCFAHEVIPANSMEGGFAGICASTTSIDAGCAGIGVRLKAHTPFAPDDENGIRSMTNWKYRFHANRSDLYESVGSAPCSVVPCSTSPSAPPSAYSTTLAALRWEAAPARS
jgi:hypothetical protein